MTSPITIIRPKLTRQLTPAEIRARALATICMGNGDLGDILMWAAEACPELVIPVEEAVVQGEWPNPGGVVEQLNGAAVLGLLIARDAPTFKGVKVIAYS